MSQRGRVNPPSLDSVMELLSPHRNSRAESESPCRSSTLSLFSPTVSKASHRVYVGPLLRGLPDVTQRLGGETAAHTGVRGDGECTSGKESENQQGHGEIVNACPGTSCCLPHSREASHMKNLLYHSIQHACGAFKLVQRLWYPSDLQGASVGKNFVVSSTALIKGDTLDDLEVVEEAHAANGETLDDTHGVLWNDPEDIESRVSTMAMCMMLDFRGFPSLALCVGDVNGRVSYCELDVSPKRCGFSPKLSLTGSKSRLNMTSCSKTDSDWGSFSPASTSVSSPFYFDALGSHRVPFRGHSHQAYMRDMNSPTSVTVSQAVKTLRVVGPHESPSTVSYLTANERVIKLFRVQREGFSPFHAFPMMEKVVGKGLASSRHFPRVPPSQPILPVRVFSDCHQNSVLDLSVCSDTHSFLSADDLQVFWWDLESSDSSRGVSIANHRPSSGSMEEVGELITSTAFHPTHNALFLVSRTSGFLGIGDLREPFTSFQCHYTTSIHVTDGGNYPALEQYVDILSSISCANFVDSQHVVTRDYLSLKLWDLRRPEAPYAVAPVMGYMTPKLDFLYENDYIFDRFSLAVDHMSKTIVTGLYDGAVAVWQPFQEGRVDAGDVLVYYQTDAETSPCEARSGGRTTAEALSAAVERDELRTTAEESELTLTSKDVPRFIANKVTSLAIADGGERFAVACEDGRCVFLFERKAADSSFGD